MKESFGGEPSALNGGAGEGGTAHAAGVGGEAGKPAQGGDGASGGGMTVSGGSAGDGQSGAGATAVGGNTPSGGEGGRGGAGAEAPACFTTVGIGGDFPHEHEMYVPFADVLAGKSRLYEMFGDHGHTVLFDEQDFARLAAGEAVEKVSTVSAPGPHVHSVRVVCA